MVSYQLLREDNPDYICYLVYHLNSPSPLGRIELHQQWEVRDLAGLKHGQYPTVKLALDELEKLNASS